MKHFLSITDLTKEEIVSLVKTAVSLKKKQHASPLLFGKTLVAVYEKPSLRTRISFEISMAQLGGTTISVEGKTIGLGVRESIQDIARVISSMADAVALRVCKHETLVEFAKYSSVPVINTLSDLEHPCQILADLMTIREKKGSFDNLQITFVGDGNNNVTHSLALACSMLGIQLHVASPKGFQLDKEIAKKAKTFGGFVREFENPAEAVARADVVITDTWVSMGDEAEKEARLDAFKLYQVNRELMQLAKPDAIFLHCMPVYRGNEVAADVVDGPQSVIIEEAENRLHAQKALLLHLLQK